MTHWVLQPDWSFLFCITCTVQKEMSVDVNIEWNSTAFNGRVMAPSHFEDEMWHCWDSSGEDVACE
ncbi:MAG: hypothetical protein KAJ23_06510 [Maribacter sp.]|nr:hypothetical protein [Maribacter sp.]